MAEIRQLGGALARPHVGGGVVSHLNGAFLAFGGAMAMTPEMARQGTTDARRLMAGLAPYASGSAYLNFAEGSTDTKIAYSRDAWRQLCAIRSAVDPDNVFAANHAVPRLYENGQPAC
jgi:FAD/FMN-containing dehydrogenase